MHRSAGDVTKEKKPKMLIRNPNDVTVSWEKTFQHEDNQQYRLEIMNELKEWNTVYCGKRTEFKATKLTPCTCYEFRVKIEDDRDDNWVYFKAATEDEGLNHSVMHMSRAVRLGRMPAIRKIAHHRHHLLETENKENKTPLVQAIATSDAHVVQLLITLGAHVNSPLFYNKRTPLMIAVYQGELQIASILVDKGANKYAQDINGLNALHYAVDSNNIESVRFCLELFEDLNCQDYNGYTPLIRAGILNISDEIINLLIEKGADIHIKDKQGFDFDKHRYLNRMFS